MVLMSNGVMKMKDSGAWLGVVAYIAGLLSWVIEDALLGASFALRTALPTLPWAICIIILLRVRAYPLKRYWWVWPSGILALHPVLLGMVMMLAWTIGGFV